MAWMTKKSFHRAKKEETADEEGTFSSSMKGRAVKEEGIFLASEKIRDRECGRDLFLKRERKILWIRK